MGRTPLSTKNDCNWELANRLASRLFLGMSIVMFPLAYVNYQFQLRVIDHFFLLSVVGGVLAIIVILEMRLR